MNNRTQIRSRALDQFKCINVKSTEADRKRKRDRPLKDPRPLFLKGCAVADANGSAYLESGNTKILCTIYGPRDLRGNDLTGQEKVSRGRLEVIVRYAPFATLVRLKRKEPAGGGNSREGRQRRNETPEELKLADLLKDTFSPAVCLDKYPKAQIDIQLTVLEDDGGVLAACVLAGSCALVDAGIQCYDLVTAVHLKIVDSQILIDPGNREEISAGSSEVEGDSESMEVNNQTGHLKDNVSLTYALMPALNQVCLCYQEGVLFSQSKLSSAINLASDTCLRLHQPTKEAILQAINKRNSLNSASPS